MTSATRSFLFGVALDLDQPIRIDAEHGALLFEGLAARSRETIEQTISEFGHYAMIYSAEIEVTLP